MTTRTHARLRGEEGAVLVEFALVAPLLVLLTLGVLDFGMAWRENNNLGAAVRAANRMAASLGDSRSTDYNSLQAYRSVMSRATGVTVDRVVVYKATGSDGSPSSGSCLTTAATATGTGVNGACNIYSATQLSNLGATYLTNFGTTDTACAGTAWDRYWCPVTRNADQGDPPDYVGVYAVVTYKSWTKLLPTTVTLTDRSVMRIEPKG